MSVSPENATQDIQSQRIEADLANVDTAREGLSSAAQGFDPESATGAAPAAFSEPEPKDQWNSIVGMAPILAAFGAVGGIFGRTHGIAMLKSTNAMMQGMVQGNADAFSDARKQYEVKYEQYRDQLRTFNDTYKAYTKAYKDRVDVADRAYKGAIAALGMDIKGATLSASQVEKMQKLGVLIDAQHEKVRHDKEEEATARIRADSQASRAATAAREADLRVEQVRNQTKTADANTLTATMRSLKSEADAILKQYPASAGKRPPDIDAKLKGIRESMDVVNERLQAHGEADYTKNKGLYDEARNAIARGADPAAVRKQLAGMGLDPEKL